ncbi:30S ribosomal protein S17 [Endomicrobiia bacterium]|uniref:Small ribosomal subunit protein uS17 n=1 Tax=Endomicrobium trichonymphae TaxID=1408204 RepID=RS17_ENDTX|nr:30S ribosomal protein S17 [Candidatus Endomicrobium trichonymphae]B1GZ92.1 RecName: Full=Small ribosomal subunit protein uS17; AltName: Full=30S ribosomal protein S17 [Candidatus Endomicrobium trichonymphae]GHT05164.1 30S ribosomal protein S17 [Endomicrobiia bacterium]BAG13574.1 30S ribosomal protein S17 [Candidatus Endomicrobium trichonymphae]BAV58656.1 30S ribosomal protein S17 [Candidatus Endomicrobium trichonymphae]GHT14441.1 30S ribosomal protein S17 [Endomicrobiia bacterium]GHT17239.
MAERGKRKFRTGIVVSDKSNKTRQVSVERTYRHSLYDRVLRSKSKFIVHDEKNISHVGDTVKIMESRPLSKMKRWVLVEVVNKTSEI